MKQTYHPWHKWECFKAGFYDTEEKTADDRAAYRDFLADGERFAKAIERVFAEWPVSCEQFLSNPSINRIAWIGQASMCIETGVASVFRGGFRLLNDGQQREANRIAGEYLERWCDARKG